jgi:hypothetical protein
MLASVGTDCPLTSGSLSALAATQSLRSLAAEFGVSHETVRSVLAPERVT